MNVSILNRDELIAKKQEAETKLFHINGLIREELTKRFHRKSKHMSKTLEIL
jgi:IS1 family transposase